MAFPDDIGRKVVLLYDSSGNALPVQDGVAIPASTPRILVAGYEGGNARTLKTSAEGALYTVPETSAGLSASMINLSHIETIGAYVSGQWRRLMVYTIPVGFSGYLIRFTTWQNEAAYSRLAILKFMGSLDFPTNVFTSGDSYTSPQFGDTHLLEAVVTTQLGAADNVVVTATYTNSLGVASRTGTFSITKSSIVGTRAQFVPQVGDVGVRSIQNLSVAPSGGAGAITVQSSLQLAFHFDLSSTMGAETQFAPAAVSFPENTVLGIEFRGGTVAKDRVIDALIQLVS